MGAPVSTLKPINRLKTRRERDVGAALYMLLMSGALRPSHIEVRYARPITYEALGRQHSTRPGRILHAVPPQASSQVQRKNSPHKTTSHSDAPSSSRSLMFKNPTK